MADEYCMNLARAGSRSLEVNVMRQPRFGTEIGQGLDLRAGVGGVAIALHHCQVLVVAFRALYRTGLDSTQEHGAAG